MGLNIKNHLSTYSQRKVFIIPVKRQVEKYFFHHMLYLYVKYIRAYEYEYINVYA